MPTPGAWFYPANQTFGPLLADGTHNPDTLKGWSAFQVSTTATAAFLSSRLHSIVFQHATSDNDFTYTAETTEPDWSTWWADAAIGAGTGVTIGGTSTGGSSGLNPAAGVSIGTVHTSPLPRTVSVNLDATADAMLCTLIARPKSAWDPDLTLPPGAVGYEIDSTDPGLVVDSWLAVGNWLPDGASDVRLGLPGIGFTTGTGQFLLSSWPGAWGTMVGSYSPTGPGSSSSAPTITGPYTYDVSGLTQQDDVWIGPLLATRESVSAPTLETESALTAFWSYWQANDTDPSGTHGSASGVDDSTVLSPVLCYEFRPPRMRWIFARPPLRTYPRDDRHGRPRRAIQNNTRAGWSGSYR